MGTKFETDTIEAANVATREANLTTYKTWLLANPKIVDCTANLLMLESYMDFSEREFTPAEFDFALSNITLNNLATQRVMTEEEVVKAENKHRRSLNLPQLHELCRSENPATTRGELPDSWYNADISTGDALRKLVKVNLPSFRALIRRFGVEVVNERLGVKPAAQVGKSIKMEI
jgi:hypothetical protein